MNGDLENENKNLENNEDDSNTKKNGIKENPNLVKNMITPMSQITDNLYLGNFYDALNIKKLSKIGIKKVLSLITDKQLLSYPIEIEHKLIYINDLPRENIIKYFGECLLFIDDNKKVLVHCMAGSSRSASIVIAYLMWKNQLDFKETVKFVEQIRPCINPNYGFVKQLIIFQKLLKKNKYNINTIDFKGIQYPRFFEECCY